MLFSDPCSHDSVSSAPAVVSAAVAFALAAARREHRRSALEGCLPKPSGRFWWHALQEAGEEVGGGLADFHLRVVEAARGGARHCVDVRAS